MADLDGVFVVEDHQTWNGGEEMVNIYHYYSANIGDTAQELLDSFFDTVIPDILPVQGAVVAHTRLRVYSLGNLSEFAESTYSGLVGTDSSGDCLPPHDAINFTLRTNTREVRPGSKRISGIAEANQSHGVISGAPYIATLNALRTTLATPLDAGADVGRFVPIVLKRVREGIPPNATYRLPESDLEVVYGEVTTVLVNLRISHQTSRGNAR